MKKILITSALPFVNSTPHLGNMIGCLIPADVLTRYYKNIQNRETYFVGGLDEYGTATEIAALQQNITPRELCDKYGKIHEEIYKWFNIQFDFFGRTSTENPKTDLNWSHTVIAQEIFKNLAENNYLIEKQVNQLYCNELNMFVADRYIIGTCPKCHTDNAKGDQCDACGSLLDSTDIINPCYKMNPDYKLVVKTSDHLFLDLQKIEPELLSWFNANKSKWSQNAISVTEAWFKKGLEPRCITRDLKWGTPVPDTKKYGDKYKNKIMYGWFDAPIGYLSIILHQNPEAFTSLWKDPDNVELIQTFSKDNIPFHTIIFPSSLIATKDNYTLVSKIASCEYLTFYGEKFSKSEGKGVFCDTIQDLSNKLGINEDYWRYYLIKLRPERIDSSFTWEAFVNNVNADLVGCYGNYVNRCFSMIKRYWPHEFIVNYNKYADYEQKIQDIIHEYHISFDNLGLKLAQDLALKISDVGNKFVQITKPWILHANNPQDPEIGDVLGYSLSIVYNSTRLLVPFIPRTSDYILSFIVKTDNSFSLVDKKFDLPFKPLKLADIIK